MPARMAGVCVIHLVWAPMGVEAVNRFVRSYRSNPPGVAHDLLVAFKGFGGEAEMKDTRAALSEIDHRELQVSSRPLDLGTYIALARELDAEVLCFLNSSAEPLASGWLATMTDLALRPDVGMVGASGSWESQYSAAPPWMKPERRRRFEPFPNPHVRTNAFVVRRDVMLSLSWDEVRRKRAAHSLESGKRSITRQLLARGMSALVAGRDGRGYEWRDWPASHTFRSGRQENLLVADNRTRDFDSATGAERRRLETLTWGAGAPHPEAA